MHETKDAAQTTQAATATAAAAHATKSTARPNSPLPLLFSVFCFLAAVWRILIRVAAPESDVPRLLGWLLVGVNVALALSWTEALYRAFFLRRF